jgi:hypothetical protein
MRTIGEIICELIRARSHAPKVRRHCMKIRLGTTDWASETGYMILRRVIVDGRQYSVQFDVESVWNVMAHGDAGGKWRGNRRMEWVGSALPLYVGTRSIQLIQSLSAYPLSSTASTRLNWLPRRFEWTRPFPWKTKSGFSACAITFQTNSTSLVSTRAQLGIRDHS